MASTYSRFQKIIKKGWGGVFDIIPGTILHEVTYQFTPGEIIKEYGNFSNEPLEKLVSFLQDNREGIFQIISTLKNNPDARTSILKYSETIPMIQILLAPKNHLEIISTVPFLNTYIELPSAVIILGGIYLVLAKLMNIAISPYSVFINIGSILLPDTVPSKEQFDENWELFFSENTLEYSSLIQSIHMRKKHE